MAQSSNATLKRAAVSLAGAALLYYISQVNYLFFHTAIEGFSVIVAVLVNVLATRTYAYSKNHLLLYYGQALMIVSVVDFLHMLAYRGMGVMQVTGADAATQLWIAGSILSGATFLFAPLFVKRKLPQGVVPAVYGLAAGIMIWAILCSRTFPSCFIEGVGLTSFKIGAEYAVIAASAAGMVWMSRAKSTLAHDLYNSLMWAMAVSIFSGLCFTFYTDVYGFMNFVGHILKLASYFLIFRGVVLRGLDAPYEVIFAELKRSAVLDGLTGIYNRVGFMQLSKEEMSAAEESGVTLGLLMLDLDKFKRVNDTYGHLAGDDVLKQFANILRASVKASDIAARLGGDEFVILLKDVNEEEMKAAVDRVRRRVKSWTQASEVASGLDVSIGGAIWAPGMSREIDALLRAADEKMYEEKEAKAQSLSPGQ
ncbi:MAG: GGDEF domain-containing protein [Firmicutes bacterium]|jgi:diguanylate cyclase (GGDEF)-like protein|nr:GGDEF domain-containing protein [Bacillota bacterium]MDD4336649.1 GGDEF domain-containing protein [Bacillota bacterium]